MKKNFILLPLLGVFAYVLFSSYAAGPGATVGDRTGASGTPGCATGPGCHASVATTSTTIAIQLFNGSTPVAGYTGGGSYTIRITGTNTGSTSLPRFGFQVAVVKPGATPVNEGTLSAITGTHLGTYTGINIVEHSMALAATTGTGGSGTTYQVDIPWTAPVTGTGSVTVYTVLNAVNFNGVADPGDLWNNTSLAIPESTAPIAGTTGVCVGGTTALSDATTGGTWSSSAPGVATVGTSGTVGGVSAGVAIITYTVPVSGAVEVAVSVSATVPTPAAIAGASIVCVGTHIIFTDATTGGTWSSVTPATATVGATTPCQVFGAAVGTDTIKYTITNGCGSNHVFHVVTVRAFGSGCVSGVTAQNPVQTELKVFPNPNRGSFTMNLLADYNEQAHVVITNMWGVTVRDFMITTNNEQEMVLNQPPGIYFVSASTVFGVYMAKVVVQ